jgi:PBP1b-binding outer membrane lipoprotein LpoB
MKSTIALGALVLAGCAQHIAPLPTASTTTMTQEQAGATQNQLENDRRTTAIRAIASSPHAVGSHMIREEALRRIAIARDMPPEAPIGSSAAATRSADDAREARVQREISDIERAIR